MAERYRVPPSLARLFSENYGYRKKPVKYAGRQWGMLTSAESKGVGEVSMVGAASAVANAVFHAAGRRVRTMPIRIDDLL